MTGIRIEHLSKSYTGGDAAQGALSDLRLDIPDNEFVTLLGPSGCGKTTTLRLIAGYLVPDTGSIRVRDRLLSAPEGVVPPEARNMGMVFQNYAVWPHKTVFENVVFGLRVRKVGAREAREKVERILDLVHLSGLEGRFPNELSGGQQQRVALARSLVVEPDILLLDEPLSNLDAKLRERMRLELKALQRRTHITFIYVTHDQAEALALSDRIAVLHKGRLQQYGTPREVYAHGPGEPVAGDRARDARRRGRGRGRTAPAPRRPAVRDRRARPRRPRDPPREHPHQRPQRRRRGRGPRAHRGAHLPRQPQRILREPRRRPPPPGPGSGARGLPDRQRGPDRRRHGPGERLQRERGAGATHRMTVWKEYR
jgi:ABC-type sugar transport system ATPase subunit